MFGLALTRSLVEAHGGSFGVTSELGEGRLPFAFHRQAAAWQMVKQAKLGASLPGRAEPKLKGWNLAR